MHWCWWLFLMELLSWVGRLGLNSPRHSGRRNSSLLRCTRQSALSARSVVSALRGGKDRACWKEGHRLCVKAGGSRSRGVASNPVAVDAPPRLRAASGSAMTRSHTEARWYCARSSNALSGKAPWSVRIHLFGQGTKLHSLDVKVGQVSLPLTNCKRVRSGAGIRQGRSKPASLGFVFEQMSLFDTRGEEGIKPQAGSLTVRIA